LPNANAEIGGMGDPVARLNTGDRIMPAMRSDPGQENLTSGTARIEGFMNGFDNMNRDQQVHARIFPGAKPSFCAISDLKDISGMFRRSRMKAAESCIHGIQRIAFTLSDFDCAILAMFNETAIDLGCEHQVRDPHLRRTIEVGGNPHQSQGHSGNPGNCDCSISFTSYQRRPH
jgi:hypothetical protein